MKELDDYSIDELQEALNKKKNPSDFDIHVKSLEAKIILAVKEYNSFLHNSQDIKKYNYSGIVVVLKKP